MSTFQKKSFEAPDDSRTAEHMKMEIVDFGDGAVVRMTCEPGWRWSEHM
ncbi:MAG TPA: cupin, partial [Ktedonobacter sp.]|nr:cupin [Ktedonobacter sp.]